MNNKLLVIEDDPGLRSQLKWSFENFSVIQAEDMDSAMKQLAEHRPTVVTLDLGLPPVRGRVSLAAWLRVARNAATHQAVVLVGSPYRLSGCAAGVVVAAGRGRGDWSSGGRAARLLAGLRSRFSLSKRVGFADLGEALAVLTLREAAFGPVFPSETTEIVNRVGGKSEIRNPRERKEKHVAAL